MIAYGSNFMLTAVDYETRKRKPVGGDTTLNSLQRAGPVQRRRASTDPRQIFARTTQCGLGCLAEVSPTHLAGVRELFLGRRTGEHLAGIWETLLGGETFQASLRSGP